MSSLTPAARARFSVLLVSSSVAALAIGGGAPPAYAGTCNINITSGTQSSVTNSSAINCINIDGATITGDVVNTGPPTAGTITATGTAAPTATGITINNASVGGAVINRGTITASSGVGIVVNNNALVARGITNAGTIVSSSDAGIVVEGVSLFSGGMTNSGTITSNRAGMFVELVSTFAGAISNYGTISGLYGIRLTAVSHFGTSTAGGITNTGAITASNGGINILGGATFMGGVSNAGTISAAGAGIVAADILSFAGGIANSGTVTAGGPGIDASTDTHFSGGITNTGRIVSSTSDGIFYGGGSTPLASGFSGGISNGGTILAGDAGIFAIDVSSFSGGIANSGTITATGHGIVVAATVSRTGVTVSTFTGGVANTGTISAGGNGIWFGGSATVNGTQIGALTVGTFAGGITNAGAITAGQVGIWVGGNASGAGATVTISTFAGGITNSGRISAVDAGIEVGGNGSSVISSFSGGVTNAGTIVSSSGAGIVAEGVSLFSGGMTNSGTITSNRAGMFVELVSTFAGAISNSGTISGLYGIRLTAVSHFGTSTAGGITNTGAITASNGGINILGGATFMGGVSNAGTISAAGAGIVAADILSFAGGIANSGTVTAGGPGIDASTDTHFSGGITNTGRIVSSTSDGIFYGGGSTPLASGFSGGISNGGTILAGDAGIFAIDVSSFSGGIANSGTITATGHGIVVAATVSRTAVTVSTFTGGVANTGTISAGGNGIWFGGSATVNGTQIGALTVGTFAGGITNAGAITAGQVGIWVGGNASGAGATVTISTFAGGITNSGRISAVDAGIEVGGNGSSVISSFSGGVINAGTIVSSGKGILIRGVSVFSGGISNSGTLSAAAAGISIGSGVTFDATSAIVNSGTIIGAPAIDLSGATSPTTIDQTAGLIAGAIDLSTNADIVNISGGTITGNIVGAGTHDTINFNLGSGVFTYNAAFTNINQVDVNSGTVVLNGANSATNVAVNGGTLAGTGSIDPTTVTIGNGGTLSPGSTATPLGTFSIVGTLAFNGGSSYAVTIAPSGGNSKTAVTGNAVLGGNGTVVVTPQLGHYNATVYQILTTTTGVTGQFAGLTLHGGFSGTMALDYTTNPGNVDLDVSSGYGLFGVPGANQNQQNVINGLNNAILNNDTLPAGFANLANLSAPSLLNALTALSGEAATDAGKGVNQLMSDFLNLMLDPTAGGGGNASGSGATGFAPEQDASLPADVALAYAKALKQESQTPQNFDQRWTAWGSAFGGASSTDGNATIGSNNVTASDYGFAAGMEYSAAPSITYGFGLAGGGTNWNLAQGLGSGRSDSFQAGVYAKAHAGPAYLSAALAFANHWFTTDRNALGDQLRATFIGQSYAARLEGGYRYAVPITGTVIGVTPYAALQAQDFHTPSYSETDLTGGGFGLSYASMNATDTRSELGARVDNLQVVDGMPLVLRGRLAWAHDWFSNATALNAVFQTLPGSNFTVNGAAPPKNSALTTAAAELHISANWTAIAKFDGDFGSGSQTYGGTGTLKYSW